MRPIDTRRWLTAFPLVAALATPFPGAFAQTAAQAPPEALKSEPVIVAPVVQPTPEQVGDALMGHQRYQAAIEAYKKAPRDSADVWNMIGIAYQMMFNQHDAIRCYQTSLRMNPRNAHVLNNLATVYDSLRDYGAAERMYHRAIKLDPHSALFYKNLGTNLLAQHKYKKGWEVYKTALTIDPHVFEDHSSPRAENPASTKDRGAMNYYMAKGCVRAGMNDCAIEYLRMALNEGYISPKKIAADREFASLRGLPAFEQLLAAQQAR